MSADRGFALYVHWPWCLSKCPYCDFNSHVAARIDQAAFARAYAAEIARFAALTPGRRLDSVFFGGGTPSLMAPETVESVLTAARSAWSFANDIEITLEANPTSVEAAAFDGLRAAGVNRVSLGLQALNDEDLRRLGRTHTVAEALVALDIARARFPRVSFDLIYARQDQTPDDWRAELTRALALGTDHLSLYQLTIEDGTIFGERHRRGLLRGLPDEDLSADLFELTQAMCQDAGLPAYEVSNHARSGHESRHNLIYWRSGEWVGIGPGAHGRIVHAGRRWATEAPRSPADWLATVGEGRPGTQDQALAEAEVLAESLVMGLRLSEGILLTSALAPAAIDDLLGQGLIWQYGSRLGTTPRGRMLLNRVVERLAG